LDASDRVQAGPDRQLIKQFQVNITTPRGWGDEENMRAIDEIDRLRLGDYIEGYASSAILAQAKPGKTWPRFIEVEVVDD
jgi:hypothetical protein